MKKYNFIIIVTFVSLFVLFIALSEHDPNVHAKMQAMEDDDLQNVDADGIYMDINVTARAVADRGLRLANGEASSDYIDFAYVEINNGTAGGSFSLNTTMCWDIGAAFNPTVNRQQGWLLGGNMYLPTNPEGMGLIANGLTLNGQQVTTGTAFVQSVGNLTMNGLRIGWVYDPGAGLPGINPARSGDAQGYPFLLISSMYGDGLEIYSQLSAYINQVKLTWNSGGSGVTANGIYIFGLSNIVAGGNPATWDTPFPNADPNTPSGTNTLYGTFMIGGNLPTYNQNGTEAGSNILTHATANLGSTTGDNSSRVRLDLPGMGSIRVRSFTLGTLNMGPIALDSLVMYKSRITFYGL